MFFKGSRYEKVGVAELTDRTGRVIRYKRTRFVPDTSADLGHRLTEGERLDFIAYQYYRDPEKFWRICDANGAMWPDDLLAEPGRSLGIPSVED